MSATPTEQVRIPFLPLYEPVRAQTESGERQYETPDGYAYSVTTVLSGSRDNSGIERWREEIGEAKADEILRVACFRGTGSHTNIENFLLHGTIPKATVTLDGYWKSFYQFLRHRIDTVIAMEGAVWHSDGYAGAFDCIAYLDDDGPQPTLIDWKTADREPKPPKLYEYKLQAAAYVAAANHVYKAQGLKIERALIVMGLPAQHPLITEIGADELNQLYLHFLARLQRFTYARSSK